MWAAYVSLEDHEGEQTSSIIIISDPMADCISTTVRGLKKCLLPSKGEEKLTPSS